MKRDETSVLVERRALSPDAFLLQLESETLARSFLPGQFTMVRIPERPDLLLRRPYSFCDSADGRFSLLVKVAGKGTRALTEAPLGSPLSCLGPLGSWFRIPDASVKPVIVAGGVGIAPFVAFSRVLAERGRRAVVLLGGRSARDLYLRNEFEALGMDVRTSSEDGTHGHRGLVTDLLANVLEGGEPVELFSCGPTPMLLRVAAMAREKGVRHQVSLERRMGCGMGCCLGCVVYARTDTRSEYLRSCTEGPVFDADAVIWDRDPYPL
jgi:dihydroorotate dehydrogenase electron transfer subunit